MHDPIRHSAGTAAACVPTRRLLLELHGVQYQYRGILSDGIINGMGVLCAQLQGQMESDTYLHAKEVV